MDAGNVEIMIMMFQYSVVVKSIERKLAELDYKVTLVTDRLEDNMEHSAGRVALMIFYLPADIAEDSIRRKQMTFLCNSADENGQKFLLIGEKKSYEDLMPLMPGLNKYRWIDRPVDMEKLENTINDLLSGKAAEPTAPVGGPSPARSGVKRILIVDDDPSYAKMVRNWIKDDYRVDIVTAGMMAITFLLKVPADQPVDMILLDYEMPVVDGPQVLQMLRQEPETQNIPVMFLTGVGTKEAVSRVMALKPNGYVLKTTTRENLLATLKSKLG